MPTLTEFAEHTPRFGHSARLATGLAFLSLGLTGCIAAYPYQPYSAGYVTDTVVEPQYVRVYQAPPPPRVEVIRGAPRAGFIWVPGNWIWHDRWAWRSGYWARPPHPRAYWERGRWERGHHHDRDDWRWRRGRWDD